MKTIAIITGDIVHSSSLDAKEWMPLLKKFLNKQGESPKDWQIYRGDAFQLIASPEEALQKCILLKSILKQRTELDVRFGIGIGSLEYSSAKITESNGTAFQRSGRAFDALKEKEYLSIATGDSSTDITLNLLARFASLIMDNWTTSAAEIVRISMEQPDWNQQQIAKKLNINQSAVSQSRKRAQLDLILEFIAYYQTAISSLKS